MKKIFIAGGSGLLGHNSSIYLSNLGYKIYSTSFSKAILDKNNTNSYIIDLCNYNQSLFLLNKIQPDLIMNFAGLTNVEECEKNPKLAGRMNVDISSNLSKISSKLKIPFLQMSTDHLFNNKNDIHSEDDIPSPINIYSKTKLESEKVSLIENEKTLVVRANFFCSSTKHKLSFIDWVNSRLINNTEIELFDDVYFTPILFSFMLDYILILIKKNHYGIINICSNEKISKYEFGCLLSNFLNLNNSLIKPISIKKKN